MTQSRVVRKLVLTVCAQTCYFLQVSAGKVAKGPAPKVSLSTSDGYDLGAFVEDLATLTFSDQPAAQEFQRFEVTTGGITYVATQHVHGNVFKAIDKRNIHLAPTLSANAEQWVAIEKPHIQHLETAMGRMDLKDASTASPEGSMEIMYRLQQTAPDPSILAFRHPYVKNDVYTIMEYAHAADLRLFIHGINHSIKASKYQSYPSNAVRYVIVQIAWAIKHMHEHGIAHLDIRPENIMWQRVDADDPRARKVADLWLQIYGTPPESGKLPQLKIDGFGFATREPSISHKAGPRMCRAPEVRRIRL
jgi:serine/threonine protein kinase